MKIQIDHEIVTGDIREHCTVSVDSDFIGKHQAILYAELLRQVANGTFGTDPEALRELERQSSDPKYKFEGPIGSIPAAYREYVREFSETDKSSWLTLPEWAQHQYERAELAEARLIALDAELPLIENLPQLTKDAELGRMVRNMPHMSSLSHNNKSNTVLSGDEEWYYVNVGNGTGTIYGSAPEEALRNGGVTP